jgi:molecular chaperone DnaK
MDADEKSAIESSIKDLEEAMKGEDKDHIERLAKALGEISGKMAERLYAQSQAGAGGPGPGPEGPAGGQPGGGKDDVVDAEFEEVKDSHK